MKQSRDNLFKKFDESAAYLQNTIDQRNNIWYNRGSYNYIEQVPYTHKFKVGGGGFWTKWVHKTETRYRPETRFNQQSYDNDWDSATAIVNQAEKVFNDHQQTIINQIDSMRQEIKSKDTEVTQIKSLTTQQNILKQKLSHVSINYYNLKETISFELVKLNSLQNQSLTTTKKMSELSSQLNSIDQSISNKEKQIQSSSLILKEKEAEADNKKSELENALSKMSNLDRAKIAYEMLITDNEEVFQLITKLGFSVECLAYIAVTTNNMQVFEFCLEMGANFDNYLISEKGHSLANMILLGGNQEIIAEMLDYQGGSLTNSIMQACTKGYMVAIEKMYLHDKALFQKNYIGTSILEAAIWQNNNELVSYIAENDPKVIEGRTCKGESYFHLALRYEYHEIIEIISKNIDLKEECISLLSSDNHDLFKVAINHGLLSQSQLTEFFIISVKNEQNNFADSCLAMINDIPGLFSELINKHDLLTVKYLLNPELKICNSTMLSDLINSYDKSSGEYQFIIEFENLCISDQINNGVQTMGDDIQAIID